MFQFFALIFDFVLWFLTDPVVGEASYAIGPLAAIGVSAASSLVGQGINRLFNKRPDVPDYVSEVRGQFDIARRQAERNQDRNTEEVQADAAAAGVNPITAMADVVESNNQAIADLGAQERDAVARAKNQRSQAQFQQNRQKFQARSKGIGSMVSGISNYATNQAAMQQEEEMREEEWQRRNEWLNKLQNALGDQTNPLLSQTTMDMMDGFNPDLMTK